jgi:hypothetical protein
MAEIQTCDHCSSFQKNPEASAWGCILPVVVGRQVNDTCMNWLCAACGQPMAINGFDGPEPKTWPVDHMGCWPKNQ